MNFKTSERVELIDITCEVENEVKNIGIKEGVCVITIPHTSAGLIINEKEEGLISDILNLLNRLVPPREGYQHDRFDNNATAHLKAILLKSSLMIPVVDGELKLGPWQSIFFAEMDGSRERSVNVIVLKNG